MRNRAGNGLAAIRRVRARRWLGGGAVAGLLLTLTLALSGCGPFGAKSGGPLASGNDSQALASLAWCDRPLITFQDDSTTSQTMLTSWSAVKDQLGFTPYLPESLPKGTCLALAGGSIHNPIYTGQLSITYVVPTVGPVSFSEAPLHQGLSNKTQCIQSTQDNKTTICVGAIANTSITIASRQPAADIQAMYGTLKPDVEWVPTSSAPAAAATPTAASK